MKKRIAKTVLKEAEVLYKRKRIANKNPLQKVTHSLKVVAKKENKSVVYWLGEYFTSNPLRSDFDLINAGSEGIPKGSIDALANHLGISRKTMAEDILDLSVKTLERKASSDKLDRRTSSHALEIAKVLQHAYEVFEDEDKVRRWINKENKSLNSIKPVILFATLTGLNMVNDILGRIEEGVYS